MAIEHGGDYFCRTLPVSEGSYSAKEFPLLSILTCPLLRILRAQVNFTASALLNI